MLSWATKFLTLQRLFGEAQATRLARASEDAIDRIEAVHGSSTAHCPGSPTPRARPTMRDQAIQLPSS